MSERRMLALLGLLLGVVAAVLLLASILSLGRNEVIDLAFLLNRLVAIVLGIVLLLGSFLIYGGRYSSGGLVNLVIGIALVIYGSQAAGILGILSGVLGLLANEVRT